MKLPTFWWLPFGRVPEIEPAQFKRWLDEGKPLQVVDARTRMEYSQGTLGKARHAPVTEMPACMARLSFDPQRPIVMLCLSGHRSIPGTRWLRARGFEAYSLKGGILAWKQAGFALEAPENTGQ
jgi:rhodanese-related sulfurtransferase